MRKRMDTKEPSKLRGGLRILSPDMPWLYVLSALVMTLLVEGLARRFSVSCQESDRLLGQRGHHTTHHVACHALPKADTGA